VPTPDGGETAATSGHYVVCGSDSTTIRIVQELRNVGAPVTVIVPDSDADRAHEMAECGARLVVAPRLNENALREAGVPTAQAIAFVMPDDLGNVHAALTAEELNPDIRMVVHVVNPRLGEFLDGLLAHCTVLSAASMAAPEFVTAALEESEVQSITVAGRTVAAGPAELLADPPLAGLARTRPGGQVELLPDGRADIVLAERVRRLPRRVHPRLDDFLTDLQRIFDARLRMVGLVLVAVTLVCTAVIHYWPGGRDFNWQDSLYYAVAIVTLTGFDDIPVMNTSAWVRLLGVGVQLLGLIMVSLVTAAIVDAFIGASLARSFGGLRGKPRGHVVVCGLGTVGTRVAELLHNRGFNVVAVEGDPDKPGVRTARALRIPVLIGDASQDVVLYEARLHRCRALLALTNNDVANLQAGLYARERNPDARIVLRLFDHEFAARVQSRLGLGTTRSVSMLAAPAFVDALLQRRVEATVAVGRRVLMVTEVTVEPGAPIEGGLLGDLVEPGMVRVLAYRTLTSPWTWDPPYAARVRRGDRIALVTSRSGLARVLDATKATVVSSR